VKQIPSRLGLPGPFSFSVPTEYLSPLARHLILTQIALAREIESWLPRNCRTKLEYRDSLLAKLRGAFRIEPQPEHGHGRARADIAFGTKAVIELKFNFNTPGKKHMLVGQLKDDRRVYSNLFAVLVGETDPDLLQELKKSEGDVVILEK
jgi:hypothetical protein